MKKLNKKYDNVMYKECSDRFIYAFMTLNYTYVCFVISIINNPTIVCPSTVTAHKGGCIVPVPQGILSPNNGLCRYSQFFAVVNFVQNYNLPATQSLNKVAEALEQVQTDEERSRKVEFLSRQIKLLGKTGYSMSDYCFAYSENFSIMLI